MEVFVCTSISLPVRLLDLHVQPSFQTFRLEYMNCTKLGMNMTIEFENSDTYF